MAAATRNAGRPVWTASCVVPVTNVPTVNARLHHVSAHGIPRRTVNAVASAIHSTANPHTGTPYRIANTPLPSARWGATASVALVPSSPAAVMDWQGGPSTIHSVGTRAVPEVPKWASRLHTIVMMMIDAT